MLRKKDARTIWTPRMLWNLRTTIAAAASRERASSVTPPMSRGPGASPLSDQAVEPDGYRVGPTQ